MKDAKDSYEKGNNFINNKEYKKAIECYKKAVEIDPKYAIAWNNMGLAYRQLNENEKAIECYKKAVEVAPKYAIAWNNMGLAYDELIY